MERQQRATQAELLLQKRQQVEQLAAYLRSIGAYPAFLDRDINIV